WLLLRNRTGQGQDHQGDVQRRRIRAPAARLPVQRAVRRRPLLPRRRPRRPRGPAGAAADRGPARVRPDGTDPAFRAGGGHEPPLTGTPPTPTGGDLHAAGSPRGRERPWSITEPWS